MLCIFCITGQAEVFTKIGVQTISGQDIAADLVIYATGYDRKYDFMAEESLEALHQTDEGIPLYRDTIPPDVQARCLHDRPTRLG